ncbi:MAG: hypothetical protein AAGG48_29960 [Planctomycetota bacterium]
MTSFFETDRDEFVFDGRTYQDFFNLYPNLLYEPTLQHVLSLDDLKVLRCFEDSEDWRIAIEFQDIGFLLETQVGCGGATLFCVSDNQEDQLKMLAFLGCFLPLIRDSWHIASCNKPANRSWIATLLNW